MTFMLQKVNIMPYVADGGITWRRVDVEGSAAGPSIIGGPIRDKLAEKYQWTINCIPLTAEQLATILTLISPQYIQATYTDPETNSEATDDNAFCNSADLRLKRTTQNGIEYFAGLTFFVETLKLV